MVTEAMRGIEREPTLEDVRSHFINEISILNKEALKRRLKDLEVEEEDHLDIIKEEQAKDYEKMAKKAWDRLSDEEKKRQEKKMKEWLKKGGSATEWEQEDVQSEINKSYKRLMNAKGKLHYGYTDERGERHISLREQIDLVKNKLENIRKSEKSRPVPTSRPEPSVRPLGATSLPPEPEPEPEPSSLPGGEASAEAVFDLPEPSSGIGRRADNGEIDTGSLEKTKKDFDEAYENLAVGSKFFDPMKNKTYTVSDIKRDADGSPTLFECKDEHGKKAFFTSSYMREVVEDSLKAGHDIKREVSVEEVQDIYDRLIAGSIIIQPGTLEEWKISEIKKTKEGEIKEFIIVSHDGTGATAGRADPNTMKEMIKGSLMNNLKFYGLEEKKEGSGKDDPLYNDAVSLVRENDVASISWLQRQLKIGYNRAALIVEAMERGGIITPPSGPGGKREVVKAESEEESAEKEIDDMDSRELNKYIRKLEDRFGLSNLVYFVGLKIKDSRKDVKNIEKVLSMIDKKILEGLDIEFTDISLVDSVIGTIMIDHRLSPEEMRDFILANATEARSVLGLPKVELEEVEDEQIEESSEVDDRAEGEESKANEVVTEDLINRTFGIIIDRGGISRKAIQDELNIDSGQFEEIMEVLESRGIVGPADSSGNRELLVSMEGGQGSEKKKIKFSKAESLDQLYEMIRDYGNIDGKTPEDIIGLITETLDDTSKIKEIPKKNGLRKKVKELLKD